LALPERLKARKQWHWHITRSGHTITDPIEKATILNDQFKSVFTTDDDSTTIPDKGPSIHPTLPPFEITEQGVFNVLSIKISWARFCASICIKDNSS